MTSRSFAGALILLASGVLAGCGDTPTNPLFGGTPGGGTTTPTVVITLSAPTASVPVGTTALITASATENGAPMADGTVVQFTTTVGQFTDGNQNTTNARTSNGIVLASLASQTPGAAKVTARVNTVSKDITVTFVPRTNP